MCTGHVFFADLGKIVNGDPLDRITSPKANSSSGH